MSISPHIQQFFLALGVFLSGLSVMSAPMYAKECNCIGDCYEYIPVIEQGPGCNGGTCFPSQGDCLDRQGLNCGCKVLHVAPLPSVCECQ